MSSHSAMVWDAAKISRPLGCPHQLPLIGPPAIVSARFGTGPRAACSTTPCSATKAIVWAGVMSRRDLVVSPALKLQKAESMAERIGHARQSTPYPIVDLPFEPGACRYRPCDS